VRWLATAVLQGGLPPIWKKVQPPAAIEIEGAASCPSMQSGSKLPHSKVASHRPAKEAFAENGMTLSAAAFTAEPTLAAVF